MKKKAKPEPKPESLEDVFVALEGIYNYPPLGKGEITHAQYAQYLKSRGSPLGLKAAENRLKTAVRSGLMETGLRISPSANKLVRAYWLKKQ